MVASKIVVFRMDFEGVALVLTSYGRELKVHPARCAAMKCV